MNNKRMKRKLKNVIIGLIVLVVIFVGLSLANHVEHNYTIEGIVISHNQDILTVTDITGETWQCITTEEFETKETVKLYFFDKATDNRLDDELKRVTKE